MASQTFVAVALSPWSTSVSLKDPAHFLNTKKIGLKFSQTLDGN